MKIGKSIIILLCLVFASIVLSFLVFHNLFSRSIESSATDHLSIINSSRKSLLDEFLLDIESSLLTIDELTITREIFGGLCMPESGEPDSVCDSFFEYFRILVNLDSKIDGFYFFDGGGGMLFSTDEDSEFRAMISDLIDHRSIRSDQVFLPVKTYQNQTYNQIYFSDLFEREGVSYMFALLVLDNGDGDVLGSVVVDIPLSQIDKIFENRAGFRKSENTYVVGSDLVMRTNSYLSSEPTRSSQIVRTENTERCFRFDGSTDSYFLDYRGISVLGVYDYVHQLDWCILSEIDEKEITQVRGVLTKVLSVLGLIFVGTLFLFLEKIVQKTNFLRKKQEALTKALFDKEKFEKAVNAASDNIFILDRDSRVIYMNTSSFKHTGFSEKEAIGKKINKLWWSLVDQDTLHEIFETIYDERKPGTWEIVSQRKNAEKYQAELFITPVLSDGEFLFALVIEHDIQKRKEIENIKDEFLGIASHELRTPMTIIRGYVSLLLDSIHGKINPKQREVLEKIDKNSEKLIAMVTDMLDLSKLERRVNDGVKKEYLDLRDLIADVSDGFKVLIGEKNIHYSTQYETYTKIESDPNLLKQILVNLIGNAVKFTDNEGEIEVVVMPAKKESMLRVEVRDNGIGIPESYRPMVFKKFSQVENYLTKKEGTGLGLAICKKAVTLLKGDINFMPRKEVSGVIFYFEIPRD